MSQFRSGKVGTLSWSRFILTTGFSKRWEDHLRAACADSAFAGGLRYLAATHTRRTMR
jgi:hypothetical protein